MQKAFNNDKILILWISTNIYKLDATNQPNTVDDLLLCAAWESDPCAGALLVHIVARPQNPRLCSTSDRSFQGTFSGDCGK